MQRKSQEEFEEQVKDITQGEYEVLGEYINNKEKIKMRHVSCGYEYYVTPNHFLRGDRCPLCSEMSNSLEIAPGFVVKKKTDIISDGFYEVEIDGNSIIARIEQINVWAQMREGVKSNE